MDATRQPEVPIGPGARIGSYVVLEQLGEGGMGTVFAAQDETTGEGVAIKLMRLGEEPNEEALARFAREARAAEAIDSPHVVRVFDHGELPDGSPYIVLERLRGQPLDQLVRERAPLPMEEAVDIVLQACEGVRAAHALGIVHRDLKPPNLFVEEREGQRHVKVLDFGISKVTELLDPVQRETPLTKTGALLGSPRYMAPEQIKDARRSDKRVDQWALGLILYKLLTRKNAFTGDTVGGLLANILSEAPIPLSAYQPDLPPGIAHVIATCLQKDPDARFASVPHLAAALRPYRDGDWRSAEPSEPPPPQPVPAPVPIPPALPPAPVEPPSAPASTNSPWLALGVAVTLVLGALALRAAREAEPDSSRGVEAVETPSAEETTASTAPVATTPQVDRPPASGTRRPPDEGEGQARILTMPFALTSAEAVGLGACGDGWCTSFTSTATPVPTGVLRLDGERPSILQPLVEDEGTILGLVPAVRGRPLYYAFDAASYTRFKTQVLIGRVGAGRTWSLLHFYSAFSDHKPELVALALAPGKSPRGMALWRDRPGTIRRRYDKSDNPALRWGEGASSRHPVDRELGLTLGSSSGGVTRTVHAAADTVRLVASRDALVAVVAAERLLVARWLDADASTLESGRVKSPGDEPWTLADVVPGDEGELIYAATLEGGGAVAGTWAPGGSATKRRLIADRAVAPSDLRAVSCGGRAWVVAYRAEGDRHRFDGYLVDAETAVRVKLWRGALDTPRLQAMRVGCDGTQGAVMALDRQGGRVVLATWDAEASD